LFLINAIVIFKYSCSNYSTTKTKTTTSVAITPEQVLSQIDYLEENFPSIYSKELVNQYIPNFLQNSLFIINFTRIQLNKADIFFTFKYLLKAQQIINVNWGNNSQFEAMEGDLFLSIISTTPIIDFDISNTGLSSSEQIALASSSQIKNHISHFCIRKDEYMNDQFASSILKNINFNYFQKIPNGYEFKVRKFTYKNSSLYFKSNLTNRIVSIPREAALIPKSNKVPSFKYCFTSH